MLNSSGLLCSRRWLVRTELAVFVCPPLCRPVRRRCAQCMCKQLELLGGRSQQEKPSVLFLFFPHNTRAVPADRLWAPHTVSPPSTGLPTHCPRRQQGSPHTVPAVNRAPRPCSAAADCPRCSLEACGVHQPVVSIISLWCASSVCCQSVVSIISLWCPSSSACGVHHQSVVSLWCPSSVCCVNQSVVCIICLWCASSVCCVNQSVVCIISLLCASSVYGVHHQSVVSLWCPSSVCCQPVLLLL